MPSVSTYEVIYLGNVADMDPSEGNPVAENAIALTQPPTTFGSAGDPLYNHIHTLSPVGLSSGVYHTNNNAYANQFQLDGGLPHTFDSNAQFQATITYADGSTAQISAVIFQDTAGNLYLAPELSQNADYFAETAGPIQSLRLTSLINNNNVGLDVNREETNFVCFARGTLIETSTGPRRIEELRPGDMLRTMDHGFQPLRWIGSSKVPAVGPMAPVVFAPGALGNPRKLVVSPQHRMLVDGEAVGCVQGKGEYFLPAKKLVNDTTIRFRAGGSVKYFHLLLDRHEIIFAETIPSESFYLGRQGWNMLNSRHQAEILHLFPDLGFDENDVPSYGPLARPAGKLAHRKKTAPQKVLAG